VTLLADLELRRSPQMTTRIREDNEAVGVTAAAGVTAVETPTALPIHKK